MSAVPYVVWVISIVAFGYIHTAVDPAVDELIQGSPVSDPTMTFLVWFWDYGTVAVVLVASAVWLWMQYQKSRYRVI